MTKIQLLKSSYIYTKWNIYWRTTLLLAAVVSLIESNRASKPPMHVEDESVSSVSSIFTTAVGTARYHFRIVTGMKV